MFRQVRISSPVIVRLAGSRRAVDGVVRVARRSRATAGGDARRLRGRRRLRRDRDRRATERVNRRHERRGPPRTRANAYIRTAASTVRDRIATSAGSTAYNQRSHSRLIHQEITDGIRDGTDQGRCTSASGRLAPASCARWPSARGFDIVGAADIDPAKVGRDLGEVAGVGRDAAREGVGRREEGDQGGEAGRRRAVHELVAEEGAAADRGDPEAEGADRLDDRGAGVPDEEQHEIRARDSSAREEVEGGGARHGRQPGFVMDALPITLTGVCERVESMRVDRVQDARIRRLPFQQKIGAGLTREQFQEKVDDGSVRHVGLAESVAMIADAIGWKLDRITDEIQPKMATETVAERVPRRRSGLRVRHRAGRRRLSRTASRSSRCTWRRTWARPSRTTRWRSTASPALTMKLAGGVHGDIATASIVVNSLPKILDVAPGLHTMRDMPLPGFFGGVSKVKGKR